VSRTALAALQTHALVELKTGDGLAVPLYAEAAARGREQLATASDPDAYRAAVRAWELPGPVQVARFARRKRWMAEAADRALAAGIRQIAVLGAGFDTLGLQLLRRDPELCVAELDRPAMIEAKAHVLSAAGIAPPWPRFAPVDLAEPDALAPALAGVGWRASEQGLFVAEFVLEYLDPVRASAVLSSLGRLAAPASRLACTVRFGDLAHDDIAAAAAAVGEPIRFRPLAAELPRLLERSGLEVLSPRGRIIVTRGAGQLLVLATRSVLV
jgi:methyltransferase (TIGR00027 family)